MSVHSKLSVVTANTAGFSETKCHPVNNITSVEFMS